MSLPTATCYFEVAAHHYESPTPGKLYPHQHLGREVAEKDKSIHISKWPEYDEKYTVDDLIRIPVQINGKVRTDIEIARDSGEDEVRDILKDNSRYLEYTKDKEIKKFIFVKNKIVNIVTA